MTVDTEKLLDERRKTHGDYAVHARITQEALAVFTQGPNWPTLPPTVRETIHMICHKLGRVVSGNPNEPDHYDDIAGYAKLISRELSK